MGEERQGDSQEGEHTLTFFLKRKYTTAIAYTLGRLFKEIEVYWVLGLFKCKDLYLRGS